MFYGELFIIKGALAICSVIYKKHYLQFMNDLSPPDGLRLLKQVREHVTKSDLQQILTTKKSIGQSGLYGLKGLSLESIASLYERL